MPKLKEMHEKWGDKLNIVSIFLDTESAWGFSESVYGLLPWVNLRMPEGNDIKERYGVSVFPSYFLISPEGKILGTGTSDYLSQVEKELKKHQPIAQQ